MDYNALNLTGKVSNPRNSTGGMKQNNAHFDVLSQFGGDINAAVAAAAAVSAATNQSNSEAMAAVANLNALAQLNQLASQNPKVAAMLQLQQQLQGMNQQTTGAGHHQSSTSNHHQASKCVNTFYHKDGLLKIIP